MPINNLPTELLDNILLEATRSNESEGERYTYGLSQAPLPLDKTKLTKYIRGPLSAESLRWDSTRSIRQVCSKWHGWAVAYNIEHVFERKWRGSERWADLTLRRPSYGVYEMIEKPSGYAVYRDPYANLKQTNALFKQLPSVANHVHRLWFNGFYAAETDRLILSVISNCPQLEVLSVPWTIVRRGTAENWIDLLNVNTGVGKPLYSLEIQGICLSSDQASALEKDDSPDPLKDPRVDFSALSRLKIFGNTLHKPISDTDLSIIARTATNLKCLDITNISTVSVAGMLGLVKASQNTLQVLEHSPRSDDGFYHPYPGNFATGGDHICELLTSLPKMRDLSISIPNMCSTLFSSPNVIWEGELQVRATDICECNSSTPPAERVQKLRRILSAARELLANRQRLGHKLSIELFFAGCIFEPEKRLVHGDFSLAQICSSHQWPVYSHTSTKGPYGSSGTYGKDENAWDAVWEDEYLFAATRSWIPL